MDKDLEILFENNQSWAAQMQSDDAEYFSRLINQQSPQYLWIGCSDSRVPANQIIGLAPGEVFVHRNVANIVVHTDLNALTVIQYAVDVLRVRHILVVGHYGCGGVKAALRNNRLGLADNWLRHVQDIRDHHGMLLEAIEDTNEQIDRLCELNAMQQVVNISHSTVLREAWERGQGVSVHAWCYGLKDGLVRDLGVSASSRDEAVERYRDAIQRFASI